MYLNLKQFLNCNNITLLLYVVYFWSNKCSLCALFSISVCIYIYIQYTSAELNVDYWPKNPYLVEACIGFFHVTFSVSLRALDDLNKILIMSKFICTLVLELIEMIADSNFWCSFTDGSSISRNPEERESRRKLKRKDRAELSWAVPPRSSSGL